MGKDFEMSETGNWNVAQDFTKTKIMKWLYLSDQYEFAAEFGSEDLFEGITMPPEVLTAVRIQSLQMLVKSLEMLINNSKFAVKTKDKEILEKLGKELNEGKPIISQVKKFSIDRDKKFISINEELFTKSLEFLKSIKMEILPPMNRADLIFMHKDELDIKKLKEQMKRDFIESG